MDFQYMSQPAMRGSLELQVSAEVITVVVFKEPTQMYYQNYTITIVMHIFSPIYLCYFFLLSTRMVATIYFNFDYNKIILK